MVESRSREVAKRLSLQGRTHYISADCRIRSRSRPKPYVCPFGIISRRSSPGRPGKSRRHVDNRWPTKFCSRPDSRPDGQAAFDGLEGDPALALEIFARAHPQTRIIQEALVIESMRSSHGVSAALLPVSHPEYSAKVAENLPCRDWGRGRGFKSILLHHSVLRFRQISENRLKSARARAICTMDGPGNVFGDANRRNRANPIRALFWQVHRQGTRHRDDSLKEAAAEARQSSLRRRESLPSLRRQSDECSRTAGAPSPCPRRRFSHEH